MGDYHVQCAWMTLLVEEMSTLAIKKNQKSVNKTLTFFITFFQIRL